MCRLIKWAKGLFITEIKIDPIAKALPHAHVLILIELQRHLVTEKPHLKDLMSADELHKKLPTYWCGVRDAFDHDLNKLHNRGLLIWMEDNKILITFLGSYLARERMKTIKEEVWLKTKINT